MAILLANWLGYLVAFLSYQLRLTIFLILSFTLLFILLICYSAVALMVCILFLAMLPYVLIRVIPSATGLVQLSILLFQAKLRYVKFARKMNIYKQEKVLRRQPVDEFALSMAERRRSSAAKDDQELAARIEALIYSLVQGKEEVFKLNDKLLMVFKNNQHKLQTLLKLSE